MKSKKCKTECENKCVVNECGIELHICPVDLIVTKTKNGYNDDCDCSKYCKRCGKLKGLRRDAFPFRGMRVHTE